MDCVRRLLSLYPERERPAALSSSILSKTPLDILLCIIDYLPSESVVAFSLSCMHFIRLLGTRHFARVKCSTKETLALLSLLARDLPDHIACSACKRLHSMQNIRRYHKAAHGVWANLCYINSRIPACVSQDEEKKTWKITELFGTTAFKMAMKRHQQQPECTELVDMMSTKKVKRSKTKDYVSQSKEECRIVQGHLIHKLQSVYIPRKPSVPMPFRALRKTLGIVPSTGDAVPEMICPHMHFRSIRHNGGTEMRRCYRCHTEYRVDFKYYVGQGWAVFFTRWKDLGTDPESELWQQHLVRNPSMASNMTCFQARAPGQTSQKNQPQLEVRLRYGEICSAFEGGDKFKFDSLMTLSNQAELFRYQRKWW